MELIFLLAAGAAFLFVYRLGLNDGMKMNTTEKIDKIINLPKIKSPKQKKAEKREQTIMRNIENYQGDSTGQESVE